MPKLDGVHIQRTQKQHSSVIVVIPILVRRALGIKAGDYVIFNSHSKNNIVEISKFEQEGKNHAEDTGDSNEKAKVRSLCGEG